MKRILWLALPALFLASLSATAQTAGDEKKAPKAPKAAKPAKAAKSGIPALKTLNDSVAFFLGFNLSQELKESGVALNPDILVKGFNYATKDSVTLPEGVFEDAMRRFAEKMQEAEAKEAAAKAEEKKKKGEAFLAKIASDAAYTKTASGLMIKTIKEGTGAQPTDTSNVVLHYEGKLTDGTIFDSSFERQEPAEFNIGQVIKGFREGVALMKVGGKYELVIPSELGYGEQGAGEVIGPNETLIFTIELLEVK